VVHTSTIDVSKLVENKDVKRMVAYLGAFKVIEADLGLFDELARVKDIKSFVTVINKFLRTKDRVLTKLAEGIESGDYDAPALAEVKEGSLEERIRRIFDVGSETVKEVIKLAEKDPHLVAAILSSLSLAYLGVRLKTKSKG